MIEQMAIKTLAKIAPDADYIPPAPSPRQADARKLAEAQSARDGFLRDRVLRYLADHPNRGSREMADEFGLTVKQVSDAISFLIGTGKVCSSGTARIPGSMKPINLYSIYDAEAEFVIATERKMEPKTEAPHRVLDSIADVRRAMALYHVAGDSHVRDVLRELEEILPADLSAVLGRIRAAMETTKP
jgi:hypothetical protein